MNTIMSNNWENHLKDDPSNEFSNKTMVELFSSFGPTKTPDTCLDEAVSEDHTVFIAQAPVSNHILFLHHFTKLGGTRMNPDKTNFVLVGTGSTAYPAQTDESIFDTVLEKIPAWTSFLSLTDADAVKDLPTRANAAEKGFRNCIPVPPFLASALIHQGGASVPELIMTAMTTIKAFDEEHKEDANFPSANTNCQMIVNWLFLSLKKKLATMPATPSINVAILAATSKLHDDFILPSKTEDNPDPTIKTSEALSQLAINVSEQTTVLQSLNNIAEENAKKKPKGVDSLHPNTLKMLLFASSEDGTDTPSTPTQSCVDFFAQKSAPHAQIHLQHSLQAKHKCAVLISTPLATALFHGNFLWDRADSPNNFCSLLFGKPSPLSSNGIKDAMLLHLKSKKGTGWSEKDLEKATNQSIIIPTTVDSMIHNIHNLAAASEEIFGVASILTSGLNDYISKLTCDLTTYEAQAATDPSFIAKVLTAVDTQVNCWLQECSLTPLRCNVDDTLVNFNSIHRQIKTRQFSFHLPASIAHPQNQKKRQRGDDNDEEKKNKRSPIQNPNQNPRWKLRSGEDYNTVFKNKHCDKRPIMNGVRMCPRWHIRGICFSGCNLAQTHVTSTSDPITSEMNAFCKLCRNE